VSALQQERVSSQQLADTLQVPMQLFYWQFVSGAVGHDLKRPPFHIGMSLNLWTTSSAVHLRMEESVEKASFF
jgi:hypothetical protein